MVTRRTFGRLSGRALLIAALILLATLLGAIPGPTSIQATSDEASPLDLAAMALTPSDLERVGLGGYEAQASGAVGSESDIAFQIGNWSDQSGSFDFVSEQIEKAGLKRSYSFGLALPDPGDPRYAHRGVYASVNEFDDDDGAADVLAVIDDMSDQGASIETVDVPFEIGAGTVLVRDLATQDLTIVFRTGRIVAFLKIVDFDEEAPSVQEAEVLADRLLGRIEDGLNGDAPGLGNHVLHLADAVYEEPYEVRVNQYVRLDTQDTTLSWESVTEGDRRIDSAGDAIDVYTFSQFIHQGDAAGNGLPTQLAWHVDVYRFEDNKAASNWLQDRSDQIEITFALAEDAVVEDVEHLENVRNLGDESFAVAYSVTGEQDCRCSDQVVRVHVRLGAVVADVYLSTLDELGIPIESAVALAETQVSCLSDNACLDPLVFSAALEGQAHTKIKWGIA